MDKNHAKFILQSYRPDGADAADADFQEALQLAAGDRELGQWLAQERSHDAIFVEALSDVNIPDSLRDDLLSIMEFGGLEAGMSSELDDLFVGAVAQQVPPAGLRDQILSAMEVEKKALQEEKADNKILKFPGRWMNVAAVAAVALVGFTFVYTQGTDTNNVQPDVVDNVSDVDALVQPNTDSILPVKLDIEPQRMSKISMDSSKMFNTSYDIDMSADSFTEVNTWLEKEGMPTAKAVPEGLISYDVEGGKKVTYENGMEGSLILFNNDSSEKYYLMVIDLESVKDSDSISSLSEVALKKCYGCPITKFNVSTWKDDSEAYILLTKAEQKKLMKLF